MMVTTVRKSMTITMRMTPRNTPMVSVLSFQSRARVTKAWMKQPPILTPVREDASRSLTPGNVLIASIAPGHNALVTMHFRP